MSFRKRVVFYFRRSFARYHAGISCGKRPLVSQLLHSEQAPKWCIIISPNPGLVFVLSVFVPREEKTEIPIAILIAIELHSCRRGQITSTELNSEIRGEFDQRNTRWHERVVVYRAEREENMRTLVRHVQRATDRRWRWHYPAVRGTTRRLLGTAILILEESMLAQLFLTLIETRPRTKSGKLYMSLVLASKSPCQTFSQVIDDE